MTSKLDWSKGSSQCWWCWLIPLWDHCPFSMARPCSRQRVLQQRAVWPMYTLLHFLHTYLYIPFLFSGSIFVLFLLQSMLASFVPDLKQVLTPALVRARLIRYERPPGIKGMQAKGLYSSSVPWSSLNGRTSNRFSGMESVSVRLSLLVYLLRSFFLGWDVVGGLYSEAMVANLALSHHVIWGEINTRAIP